MDDISDLVSDSGFCICEYNVITSEEEQYTTSNETRAQIVDFCCDQFGMRPFPRTRLGKIRNRLAGCCNVFKIFCCPPCPDSIIHKLAFSGFKRSSYDFIPWSAEPKNGLAAEYRLQLLPGSRLYLRISARWYDALVPQLRCFLIKCCDFSAPCRRIACVYAANLDTCPASDRFTILYSHNGGNDLGPCIGFVLRLAVRYCVNIFSYDYSGFGLSDGNRSEEGVYRSAEVAYEYLTNHLQVEPSQIVLMGTSLGTAAAIYIAATRPVRGVILQGSFLSAFRILCPSHCRISNADQFNNIEQIENVTATTLFVHGKNDQTFSLRHAKLLRESCPGAKNVEPLYLKDCNHLDFGETVQYWAGIHRFLHEELVTCDKSKMCCTLGQRRWLKHSRPEALDPTPSSTRSRKPVQLCHRCLCDTQGTGIACSNSDTLEEIRKRCREDSSDF